MKYTYSCSIKPVHERVMGQIDSACRRLASKLQNIDLKDLSVSEYNQRYLGEQIKNLTPVLQTHAYLLGLNIAKSEKALSDYCIVDYGGGAGLISLLAKEMGVGKVIYNDIYDISCRDAQLLSKEIELEADSFICGDINEVIDFFDESAFRPDAIVSFDVIEHIYDIEGYLKQLPQFPSDSWRIVFGSGANGASPILKRRYTKAQIHCGTQTREATWGRKKRDSLKAYIDIRKDIIKQKAPQLDTRTIYELAIKTRGRIKQDIEWHVEEFLERGKISYKPDHPTNTCDPITGNWAEHLMNTEWLESILNEAGFTAKTISGYWGETGNALTKSITILLNSTISLLRNKALALSPYYVIVADRNA